MTLELIISQPQPAVTGNPECDNIEQVEITNYSQLLEIVDNQCNVPWIQANIQFLNTIKGEPGNTPYIGENGNWWIGTTDTGTKAAGEDGKTPTIGENKHWFINGVDTGIIAEGQDGYTPQKGVDYFDGLTPYIGMNGNWWIGDVDQNIKAEGVDGISPTIGLNGNWYLGAVDTGVKAQGQDGYTPVKDVDYFDGITPTIGLNKHWFIGAIDTGIVAEGKDGEDGVTPIITIGENENWYINGVDSGKPSRGTNGTSAYEIYLAGGGTLSEVDFNASITNIPSHIEDATKHIDTTTAEFSGTIDETNDKLTIWDNSLLKWIRFSFTSLKTYLNGIYHKFGGSSFGAKQIIGSIDNQDFGIITNNTERITVLKNGNVWIGSQSGTGGSLIVHRGAGHIAAFTIEGSTGNVKGSSGYVIWQPHNYANANNTFFVANNISGDFLWKIGVSTDGSGGTEYMRLTHAGNLGIKTTAPKSALQVAGGIQCGDDTAAASADKAGTERYRETANASYFEKCMKVGANSYAWVAIVTNTW